MINEIILSEINSFLNENSITLYHGSGHLFNTFDITKINTGQRSQDFGYGLYFTTNKETATFYANELSNTITPIEKYNKYIINNEKDIILYGYLVDNRIISAKRILTRLIETKVGDVTEWQNLLNSLNTVERYGYVYTTTVMNPNFISKDDYVVEKHRLNISDKEMSKYLLSKGYDGIKYKINSFGLNKTSDLSKEYNVVMFDDKKIRITNRERVDFTGTLKLDYIK